MLYIELGSIKLGHFKLLLLTLSFSISVSKLRTDNCGRPEHILIQGLKENNDVEVTSPQNRSDEESRVINNNSLDTENSTKPSIDNYTAPDRGEIETGDTLASLREEDQEIRGSGEAEGREISPPCEESTHGQTGQLLPDQRSGEALDDGPDGQKDPLSVQGESLDKVYSNETPNLNAQSGDAEKTTVAPSCEEDDLDLSTLSSKLEDLGKPRDNLTNVTNDILNTVTETVLPETVGEWKVKPDQQNTERHLEKEEIANLSNAQTEKSENSSMIATPCENTNTSPTRSLRSRTAKLLSNVTDEENNGQLLLADESLGEEIPPDVKCKDAKLNTVRRTQNLDRSHMKRPHYKREPNIQCQFCKARLKDRESLFDHARLKHSHSTGYSQFVSELREAMKVHCQVCQRVYSRRDQLAVHMKVVHSPSTNVDCPKCGVSVKSEKHLKDHMRRIHNNSGRVFLCHLCPAAFKVQAYLSAHLKYVHTSNQEDAHPCDQCDKTYSTEKYLRNHKMRVHGAKRHECGLCGKAFTTFPNLRRHMLLLHEKKGDKPFSCQTCNRRFSLKANWKDHVNTIHLNTYSLRCALCDMGFRRKKDLQAHEAHAHGSPTRTAPILRTLAPAEGGGPVTVVPVRQNTQPPDQAPAQEGSGEVQYIIATPEMLQAFGIQMAPQDSTVETELMESSEDHQESTTELVDDQTEVQVAGLTASESDPGLTVQTIEETVLSETHRPDLLTNTTISNNVTVSLSH